MRLKKLGDGDKGSDMRVQTFQVLNGEPKKLYHKNTKKTLAAV